jgi:integrase
MAIKSYLENGKKYYEVYVNGFDSRGIRVQRRKCGIETQKKSETVEFELKRELAKLKEEAIPFRWSEWFAECLKRMKVSCRPSTVEGYDKQLRKWMSPRWDDLELQTITQMKVYNVIFEELNSDLSPHTRKTILKMTRRVFQMAVESGILDRNPCVGIQVKVPEVEQKVLTATEVEIFLRNAKLTNHRFYPIWALALGTGMRSGELFALLWTDLDFEGRTISVTKQWTSKNGTGPTKTQRSRVVPISDDLLKFLKELKLKRGAEDKHVLPQFPEWENGEQARITREFCAALEITSVKFHDLRATFITSLLSRGVPLAQVMSIVGHSQLKTTNGYLRKAGVDVQGATEKLGYTMPDDMPGAKVLSLVQNA